MDKAGDGRTLPRSGRYAGESGRAVIGMQSVLTDFDLLCAPVWQPMSLFQRIFPQLKDRRMSFGADTVGLPSCLPVLA